MPICPQCGKDYADAIVGCPDCSATPARFGPEHDLHLVSVYRAQDELSAHLIHGALTNNGVPAYIHSEQIPMMGTILQADHGCWGEVMAPEAYRDQALEIVRVFTTENSVSDAALEQEAMAAPAEDAESPAAPMPAPVPEPPVPNG